MDQIAHFIDLFFDINSSSKKRDMQLYAGRFIDALKRRINREENILFPAFERLQKNKFLGVRIGGRIADRRIADRGMVRSLHEGIDNSEIVNKRKIERRQHNRQPIHNLFVIYKEELLFYIFILIVCIIAATIGVFVIHSPETTRKFVESQTQTRLEKKEFKKGKREVKKIQTLEHIILNRTVVRIMY